MDQDKDKDKDKASVEQDKQPQPEPAQAGSGWSMPAWLLSVLALLVGVLLGATVVGAGVVGDDDPELRSPRPPAGEAVAQGDRRGETSGDLLVRVPAPCLEAAETAKLAADEFDELAAAAQAFDARRLQELLNRFQQLQGTIEQQAKNCRAEAGEGLQSGSLVTGSPAATPSS